MLGANPHPGSVFSLFPIFHLYLSLMDVSDNKLPREEKKGPMRS